MFRSHLDGQPLSLSPESAADIQMRAGRGRRDDVRRVPELARDPRRCGGVDGCGRCAGRVAVGIGSWPCRLGRSRRWPGPTPGQVQFGIVQGGTYKDLATGARQGRSTSGSRPTPSAVCRWGSRPTSCTTSSGTRLTSYRPTGPVSHGCGHARRPRGVRGSRHRPVRLCPARRETPETGSCSRGAARSPSRMPGSPTTPRRPILSAAARRAGAIRGPICATSYGGRDERGHP